MRTDSKNERLERAIGEAVALLPPNLAGSALRVATSLTPGDVIYLPSAAPLLSWAVLEVDRSPPARLSLVAADVQPFVGSRDLALNESPEVGQLSLRLGHQAWVVSQRLGWVEWSGRLSARDLAFARRELKMLIAQGRRPGLAAAEVDAAVEYREWVETTLEPALARLRPLDPGDSAPQSEAPVLSGAFRRRLPQAWRLAAGLAFLVLGGGFGLLLWHQERRLSEVAASRIALEQEAHRQLAALEAERAQVVAELESQLHRNEAERQQQVSELSQRLTEVERKLVSARSETALLNPVIAVLVERPLVRGSATRILVGPESSHIVFELRVPELRSERYRVLILDGRGGLVVDREGLLADGLGEVRVGVARSALPPGDYRVRLLRQIGQPRLVVEHNVEVIEEGRPRWR